MSDAPNAESTVRSHFPRPAARGPAFRLVVVSGADVGKFVEIGPTTPGPTLVGTSSSCDLVLTDRRVSRRHASITHAGSTLHLVDLGSTNGTLANAMTVVDAFVSGGAELQLGETTVRVEQSDAIVDAKLWPFESFGRVLGASVAMRRLYPLCQKYALSDGPVIVEGETGTGKELLAETLHELGSRKNAPFVVFDARAAEPKDVEAILLGVDRGRAGALEEANGGTLLLDEIGELPPIQQAKLLHALERGEVCRMGSHRPIAVDVRIVATTHLDLEREVERGRFREDLFYRLAVGRIQLPPLRQRDGDVPLLAAHFWRLFARSERAMPADLLAAYESYAWPGNVRELANFVSRRVALGDLAAPGAAATPPASERHTIFERVLDDDVSLPEARARIVAEFERCYIERILARHRGNVSRAAAASGIARRYFQLLRSKRQ